MSVDHYSEALRHLAEADAHVAATHRHRSCQVAALVHALLEVAVRLQAYPPEPSPLSPGPLPVSPSPTRRSGQRSWPQTAPVLATGTPQARAGAPPGGDEPDSGEAP